MIQFRHIPSDGSTVSVREQTTGTVPPATEASGRKLPVAV